MGVATAGALARLLVKTGAPIADWTTGTEPYEFIRESVRKQGTILDTGGLRGTRSHHNSRTREGIYTVGGALSFHPSPNDLDKWLPRILGGPETSDSFPLLDTLETNGIFSVLVRRGPATGFTQAVFEYIDCRVNRATFRGSSGTLVEMELDIIGKSHTQGTVTFPASPPSLGVAANDEPFVFHEGVLTLKTRAVEFFDFELTIDNFVDASFRNSQTAKSLIAMDRLVTLRCTTPFTPDEYTGTATELAQEIDGQSGNLKFTNGQHAISTDFRFNSLQWAESDPVVGGKQEVPLVLEMIARRSSSGDELEVINDSTV